MPIFRHLIVYAIAALALTSVCSASTHRLSERPDGLYESGDTIGQWNRISNPAHYESADRAEVPTYVILGFDAGHTWLKVMQCDATGEVTLSRTISDPSLAPVTAIMSAEFLPDGRLFVQAHISPKVAVGVAVDLLTGKSLCMTGSDFTCDSTGKRIAYFVDAPQSAPPSSPMELWVDGKKLREVPAGEMADLSWSPNGSHLTVTYSSDGHSDKDKDVVVQISEKTSVADSN